MSKQTLKDGTLVTFMIRGMIEDFKDLKTQEEKDAFIRMYGNKPCTVKFVSTSKSGHRIYEHYDITFKDGKVIKRVSGFHLHEIPAAKK